MQSIHCEKIGYPTTISGTVARYTEIRPKLIYRYLNTFPTWVIYTSDKVYSAFVSATNDTGEFVIEAIALLLADNVQYFGPMWFAVKGGSSIKDDHSGGGVIKELVGSDTLSQEYIKERFHKETRVNGMPLVDILRAHNI
eukprot:379278_1